MGHKKHKKYGLKVKQPPQYTPAPRKKKSSSGTIARALIGVTVLAVIVASIIIFSQPQQSPQPGQSRSQSYPANVAPVFYDTPTLTSNEDKVVVPASYVSSNRLVFVDLKLQSPMETLPYQGRTVPLAYYKNGGYLPLVLISTPSGNTIAGIRTCEPCGSFSFHIVKGTNLKCDVCGAEWNLEDFAPASGGCATYPPPKLTSAVNGDNLEIDLSNLQVQVAV